MPRPPRAAAANRSGENAFNPAISLILQGTYARTSQDPNNYHITGFLPSGGEVGPPKRSFGLQRNRAGHGSANIDPYFRGVAIASLAPEGGVSVEEAYFQTLALPQGFTLKGGRFFSGIGYLNEQHQHAWDFQDAPLPYKAFLGTQLKQDGLQLKWIAPTDLFVELGAEVRARRPVSRQRPQQERHRRQRAVRPHRRRHRRELRRGAPGCPICRPRRRTARYQDTDALGNAVTNAFTGDAKLWVADAVLKWAPNGNATYTNFKLQGEYFRLKQDGQLTYNDTRQLARPPVNFNADQSGWYLQGIWQFMPRWRVGYRYDTLRYGTVNNGIVTSGAADRGRFPAACELQPVAQHADVRLEPRPSSAASGCSWRQDKSRLGPPTTRCSCNTSTAWARMARTSSERLMNSGERYDHEQMAEMHHCAGRACWRRNRRLPRSIFSPASPNGARWRRNWAATRSSVYVATNALQDPHHIEARPSLIARARNADLVVCTGAELEIGWLPLLQTQSGNPKIQTGQPGYFEASRYVAKLEVPQRVDRAQGDVHPGGNPHIHLDPRNIAKVAAALAERMAQLDSGDAAYYQARTKAFLDRWQQAIARWEKEAAPLKGMPIVVYHKNLSYLDRLAGHARKSARWSPSRGCRRPTAHLSELLAQLANGLRRRRSCAPPTTIRGRASGWPSARKSRP